MVAENNPNLWLLQTAAAKLEPLILRCFRGSAVPDVCGSA
jgi:hypothetical protein